MGNCPFLDGLFGNVGEGVHRHRFLGLAIVDVIQTIILAFIISKITKRPFGWILLVLFVLGIVIHRIFDVKTTIDRKLFKH